MITRRRLLLAAISIPAMGVVIAKSSNSPKDSGVGLHLRQVFQEFLNDPHIHVATVAARQSPTATPGDINRLLFDCSGCSMHEAPEKILNGFKNRKQESLASFRVTNVQGYMLTPEERLLGQILALV